MAYHFKRKERLGRAVRRLGEKRIRKALESLSDRDHVEAVHRARKEIKKMRALLRLVEARLPKRQLRRLKDQLRDAAAKLAGPRDAYVKTQALAKLEQHFKRQLLSSSLRSVRAQLRDECVEEMKRFRQQKVARATGARLRGALSTLDAVKLRKGSWKTISAGIERSYRAARKAYRTALTASSADLFHAWRKRAKDLRYHVQLLNRIWPERMRAMTAELETLTEQLGDDHDLEVLRLELEPRNGNERDWRTFELLAGLISERQRELRASALAAGTRFFADKPATFCAVLGRHWRDWRKQRPAKAARAVAP